MRASRGASPKPLHGASRCSRGFSPKPSRAKAKEKVQHNSSLPKARARALPEAAAPPKESLEVARAFRKFDVNNDGLVERSDLSRVLQNLDAVAWTDKKVDRLVEVFDANCDGRLDYNEFCLWLFSSSLDATQFGRILELADTACETKPADEALELGLADGSLAEPTDKKLEVHEALGSADKVEEALGSAVGAYDVREALGLADGPSKPHSWKHMILHDRGEWTLRAGPRVRSGKWSFRGGKIYSALDVEDSIEEEVGTPVFDPISPTVLPECSANGDSKLECFSICESEIMKEIQNSDNAGAYFVLPSQLNGAEYPSHDKVVTELESYRSDDTGGPRGQLAVHPAAGQFMLDNAASDANDNAGINAVDQILQQFRGTQFLLKNGYFGIDTTGGYRELQKLKSNLHTLRPLVMMDVRANGLRPSKRSWSTETHHVNLVYASAVPVDSYLNRGRRNEEYQCQVAEIILVGQYYGAMKFAATSHDGTLKRIFLMPLGGGVFDNPRDCIARAMAKAVEMLRQEERDKLDIRVLTWEEDRTEAARLARELIKLNKLREGHVTQLPPLSSEEASAPAARAAPKLAVHRPFGVDRFAYLNGDW